MRTQVAPACALLLAAACSAHASTPSGTLLPVSGSPFPAGNSPAAIAVADFNSDGKPDLAIANRIPRAGAVSILLGNGSGGFSYAASAPAGDAPWAIVAGDWNGDGAADLAVANFNSDNLTVLLGDGHGAFRAASGSPFALPANGRPASIAAGDFNRDGKLDLAVGELFGGVSILLGNGTGSFTPAAGSPLSANGAAAIAVADFNADGKPDLAVGNNYAISPPPGTLPPAGKTVAVWLGNGSGGFTPAPGSPFATGSSPAAIAVADFNSDGRLDLAVLGLTSHDVTLILGNGFGGFTPGPGGALSVGTNADSLIAADVNGDGLADLVVGTGDPSGIVVLLGAGSAAFTQPAGAFSAGQMTAALAAADFNGDGRIDLASADITGGVTVLVGGLAPTTVLLSTTAPATLPVGQSIPLRAQVAPAAASFATPSGNVTFFDSGTQLATVAIAAGGTATYTIPALTPGSHTVTASYLGDARSAPSASNTLSFAPPAIRVSGVTNGASFQPGVAAPNTILSLFGSNLGCASGPQVVLDGAPAEILAAADSQINFVTPSAVVSGAVSLQVACGADRSDPYPLGAAAASPAFFTASATGAGQASIVNQDGRINGPSAPAARGEYISVFATGLGRYAQPDSAGLEWTLNRVAFFLGEVEAQVLFAGRAPGFTPGLQQINVLIPEGAPAGAAVPIRLSVGSVATQQTVTAAIR